MAGVKQYKVPQTIDGVSIVPTLKGKADSRIANRSLIWNFPNVWDGYGPGINLNCAIRRGDWKLIYYYATGRKELFNIASNHEKILQDKPIAFAFSKVDILDKYRASLKAFENTVDLKQNSLFTNRNYAVPGSFTENDFNLYLHEFDQKDNDFRMALADCEMESMLQNNNWDQNNVKFFGVSSLGTEPERDGSLDVDKVSPYRVLDPLVWVMHKLGKIEIKNK